MRAALLIFLLLVPIVGGAHWASDASAGQVESTLTSGDPTVLTGPADQARTTEGSES